MQTSHELLERRTLLSGLVWFDAGVLLIIGTDGGDSFEIAIEEAGRPWAPGTLVTVHSSISDQPLLMREYFPAGSLSEVVVSCREGDDSVRLHTDQPDLGVIVFGDDGDDTIHVVLANGDAGCSIFGGEGNDTLSADAVGAATAGVFIMGEGGDDLIVGTDLNDQLFGDADPFQDIDITGNDTIFGRDGKDHIWGGPGDDFLYGEGGDDLLVGGPGSDWLDGGKGHDLAFLNDDDKVYDLEELLPAS